MNKVVITLSQVGQRAAARAGLPAQVIQEYELPQDLVAEALDLGAAVTAEGDVVLDKPLKLDERPVDAASAVSAYRAEEAVLFEKRVKRLLDATPDQWVRGSPPRVLWPGDRVSDGTMSDPRVVTRREEIEKTVLPGVLAEWQAKEAERAAWIQERGSEHLRLLHAGGFEWMSVYEDERLAVERPGWAWSTREASGGTTYWSDVCKPSNPTLDVLRAVQGAKDCTVVWAPCHDGGDYFLRSDFLDRAIYRLVIPKEGK